MFDEISASDFSFLFKTEEDCRQFLHQMKWKNGYSCRRCGKDGFWKGRTSHHSRCKSCGYDESVTSFTIFHKGRLKLIKAFAITFQLTRVEEISALQIAGLYRINEKTALLLKRKIMTVYGLAAGSRRLSGPKMTPLKIIADSVSIPENLPIFAAQKLN